MSSARPAWKKKFPGLAEGAEQGLDYRRICHAAAGNAGSRAPRGKKPSGRTQEIQRLIGRSLRAVVDLEKMKDLSICIDCDVIQADGGTRTASITGGFVALYLCIRRLLLEKKLKTNPIREYVAAISCAIHEGEKIVDVDYEEDSHAQADMNFVLTESGKIVEIQGTAEGNPFDEDAFKELLGLARGGIAKLIEKQRSIGECEHEDGRRLPAAIRAKSKKSEKCWSR